jgi:hypothetical protein
MKSLNKVGHSRMPSINNELTTNKMINAKEAFETAEDLYKIFLFETTISPALADVVETAMKGKDNASVFKASWVVSMTWAILQSHRIKEMVDQIEGELKQEATKN